MRGVLIPEEGNEYGLLVVLEYAGMTCWHAALWRCVCRCGNETIVTGHDLRRGRSTNCGCIRSRKMSAYNRERSERKMTKKELFTSHQDKPTVSGRPADNAVPTEKVVRELVQDKPVVKK